MKNIHINPRHLQAHRAGFTLVELLVTITIIAVLAGISSMAYTKLRERANSVVSANNLRQWGQALMLYTTDNIGMLPYEGDRDTFNWPQIANDANRTSWFNALPPYVGQKPMAELTPAERQNYAKGGGIHYCPLIDVNLFRNGAIPAFSYMMNSQLYNPQGPSDSTEVPIRLTQILEPTSTVIFADLDQGQIRRARGRGRHVDDRQPGGQVHLVFVDGSMRAFPADYVRAETHPGGYTDNNKPDIIWNPWVHPRTSNR